MYTYTRCHVRRGRGEWYCVRAADTHASKVLLLVAVETLQKRVGDADVIALLG
jgi:hypothetical protein